MLRVSPWLGTEHIPRITLKIMLRNKVRLRVRLTLVLKVRHKLGARHKLRGNL